MRSWDRKQRIRILILFLTGLGVALFSMWISVRHSQEETRVMPSEQKELVPAVPHAGKERRPSATASFCAPESTVYLTQSQQEYKLGERKPNPPDVKQARREGADAKISLRVVDSEAIGVVF